MVKATGSTGALTSPAADKPPAGAGALGQRCRERTTREGAELLGAQAAAPGRDVRRAVGLQNSGSAALAVSHRTLHTDSKLTGIRRRSCGFLQHTLST